MRFSQCICIIAGVKIVYFKELKETDEDPFKHFRSLFE